MEKNNQTELVSICIPSYNAELYIKQTIDCLITQTYSNLEIIVVDDGSTDKTVSLLTNYTDPRLKVLHNPKKNAASARNYAYLNSKGNYIIFFDADDLIKSDFIEKQLNKIIGNENSVVISNWGRFYNDDLNTYKENSFIIKNDLTYKEWILGYWYNVMHTTPPGRLIFSKTLIAKTPLWDESLNLNDDFQFFNELFFHCDKIIYSDAQFYYRSGIGGLSSKNSETNYISCYNSLKRGISLALDKYGQNEEVKLSCANVWQNFKYELYPRHTSLIAKVDEELKKLPTPNFKYPAGGLTKFLSIIVGWKLTKHLKHSLNL